MQPAYEGARCDPITFLGTKADGHGHSRARCFSTVIKVSRCTGLSPCTMAQIPTRQRILASQNLWKHEGQVMIQKWVAVVGRRVLEAPHRRASDFERETERNTHNTRPRAASEEAFERVVSDCVLPPLICILPRHQRNRQTLACRTQILLVWNV